MEAQLISTLSLAFLFRTNNSICGTFLVLETTGRQPVGSGGVAINETRCQPSRRFPFFPSVCFVLSSRPLCFQRAARQLKRINEAAMTRCVWDPAEIRWLFISRLQLSCLFIFFFFERGKRCVEIFVRARSASLVVSVGCSLKNTRKPSQEPRNVQGQDRAFNDVSARISRRDGALDDLQWCRRQWRP